jgi:hypothetical protein
VVVVLTNECGVDVVLQRFTVSVTIVVGESLNLTRVTVLVLVNVCSEEWSDVWVDREIVMVLSPRLVLSTRVRRVEVMVRVIRVGEAVDDSTRVDDSRLVDDSRGVDDAVGETCKECVEMVLTTVVVERW